MLLASFPGTALSADVLQLLEDGLGGLCIFSSNTSDGPRSLASYIDRARAPGPIVIAIDEEGGEVTRLHSAIGSPYLGAGALGAAGDLDLTRRTAVAIGAELAGLGVNLALAPVADVNTNAHNPVIGVRSFGTDPEVVSAHVRAWIGGLHDAGVAACAKHFPGHGDTRQDSHVAIAEIEVPAHVMEQRELVPFGAAIDAGVDAVMTSHVIVRSIDSRVASLSGPLLSLLRGKLGFAGVILSDALDMAAVSRARGIPRAAVAALVAGNDLLCIGPDKEPDLIRAIQREIVTAVRAGRLDAERLAAAAGRVTSLAAHRVGRERVARLARDQRIGAMAAIRVDGQLPDLDGASIVKLVAEESRGIGEVDWGLPSTDGLSLRDVHPPPATPLIVQVRDIHRHPDLIAFVESLSQVRSVVLIEWGWPADRRGALATLPRVVPHGTSIPSRAAVADLLHDAGWRRSS